MNNVTPTAELIGRVVTVDYGNKGNFTVHTQELNKNFKVFCPLNIFCPIQEGDVIYALVTITGDNNLTIIRPPFVQIATDKNSILRCFMKVLRGTGFGDVKANFLFDKLSFLCGDNEKGVINYLSELAKNYVQSGDESLFSPLRSVIPAKSCKDLLTWWHKHRTLRRLYLFGLNNKEIEGAHMSHEEIYQSCLNLPYRIPSISMAKCEEILFRQGKSSSDVDKKCGEILRKIYFYLENRAWTGVPSKILLSQFPDYVNYKEKLKKDYNIDGDLFTIYLQYPLTVEKEVSSYIYTLSKSDYSGEKLYGEPIFSLKTLSYDQKEAIIGALDKPISIVTGPAGTGKSTIIKEIIKNLEIREIPYAIVSFTGKAVARIREIIEKKSPSTMHRMIKKYISIPKFSHLIVDETSMVTTSLFYEFIKKFPDKYNITFIGDCNQLQPIEWGSLFDQLIKSNAVPVYKLINIHRTLGGNDDGITYNCNQIINFYERDNEDEFSEIETKPFDFKQTINFSMISGNIEVVYDIIKMLHSNGISCYDLTIVTPFNREIDQLNKMVQQIYHDEKGFIVSAKGTSGEKIWKIGDRVMMVENNYEINIMNGEEGEIIDFKDTGEDNDNEISVKFKDGSIHNFKLKSKKDEENFNSEDNQADKTLTIKLLSHCYAVTIHKSQGSEWQYVIVYFPQIKTESSFLSRNMIYTAISRGSRAVWCIGDLESLKTSAQRFPLYRCDNLATRMKKFENN